MKRYDVENMLKKKLPDCTELAKQSVRTCIGSGGVIYCRLMAGWIGAAPHVTAYQRLRVSALKLSEQKQSKTNLRKAKFVLAQCRRCHEKEGRVRTIISVKDSII